MRSLRLRRGHPGGESGMVTVETAATIPVVLLVLAMVLASVRVGVDQVRCVDAARAGLAPGPAMAETGFAVEDLGSLNGTYVNRVLVEQATPLRQGDEVQIGKFRMVFCLSEAGSR